MKEGRKCNKIVSLVLAAIMMISVFAVSTPEQVQAAGELSFKGKGSSSVSITDNEDYVTTNKASYVKLTPKADGYVSIKISTNSDSRTPYGFITFCKGNKKPIGVNQEFFNTNSSNSALYNRTYGVRKGKTYYVKVESYGGVKLTATLKTVKKSKSNTWKKATTLKKNKFAKGVIIAGENKADWYKIKLTKRQKLKIIYKSKTNGVDATINEYTGVVRSYSVGGIRMSLYDSKGKFWPDDSSDYDLATIVKPSGTGSTYQLTDRYTGKAKGIDPGTYYIKVERHLPTSSGYYEIKWK